jgi:cell division GTPase FtsZ
LAVDKYLHITEDTLMDTIDEYHEIDDRLDAQRDIIRQSLDAIVNDIGIAMRDVGLTFPLYITVRDSGDALVTIATSLDPSDEEWEHARQIVCRTLEERVGCDRLRGRELACAIANAGAINAADVTAD